MQKTVSKYSRKELISNDIWRLCYYPFGMMMPERSFTGVNYRFGFNGKENDNEIKGNGNSIDFGARIYDSRLGYWLAQDPKIKLTPWYSPYSAFGDNPILNIDKEGKTKVTYLTIISNGETTVIKIVDKKYTKPVDVTVPVPTEIGIMNNVEHRQYDVLETQTINYDDPKKSIAMQETLIGTSDNGFEKTAKAVGRFFLGKNGGGIEFTSVNGQGQETRIGTGEIKGPVNIDDLIGTIDAAHSAASMTGVKFGGKDVLKKVENFADNLSGLIDAHGIGESLGEAARSKMQDKDSIYECDDCGRFFKNKVQVDTNGQSDKISKKKINRDDH